MTSREWIWRQFLYQSGPNMRYRNVIVLAWHPDGKATVLEVDAEHNMLIDRSVPYEVDIKSLSLGSAPVEVAVPS